MLLKGRSDMSEAEAEAEELEKRYSGASHGPLAPITPDSLLPMPGGYHEWAGCYRIIMVHNFEGSPLGQMKKPEEYVKMMAEKIDYMIRDRLICDGLATLIDLYSESFKHSYLGIDMVPSRYVKKPLLLMPYKEFHDMYRTLMKDNGFVETKKLDWEEYI
jgi:hypothetical protein